MIAGVFAALLALAASDKRARAKPAAPLVQIVIDVVEDDQFAPLSADGLERTLAVATDTFAKKFGVPGVRFVEGRELSTRKIRSQAFFKRLPQDDFHSCLARFDNRRAIRLQDFDRPRLQEGVASFLSRWRLPALLPAFPPELRQTVRTHDDAARALIAHMRGAAQNAFEARFSSGEPVLEQHVSDDGALGRRFVDWLCAFEVQSAADVVLTNAYVFYDLLTEPYPHAVYHGSRLAGAVMQSPARELFLGRAVFVSSFGTEGEPQSLLEPNHEALLPAEREAFVGTYLLAHELGHALLRIPDVYDHPPRCLMTTDYSLGYIEGFERLNENPGRCPRCAIYVDARRAFEDFDRALQTRRLAAAEKLADRVVRRLPANIDGSLGEYAARIYTRVGWAELDAKKPRMAELYARKALTADPLHAPARVLLRKVSQRPSLPSSR